VRLQELSRTSEFLQNRDERNSAIADHNSRINITLLNDRKLGSKTESVQIENRLLVGNLLILNLHLNIRSFMEILSWS